MLIDDRAVARPSPSSTVISMVGTWPWPAIDEHLRGVERLVQQRLAAVATLCGDAAPEQAGPGGESERSARAPRIDLARCLDDLVTAGGKRIRPVLALLGHRAVGGRGTPSELITVGAALELLHTFALAQDDVMDGSATRRGRPTVHVELARLHRERNGAGDSSRYGQSLAILAGDLAHAEAQDLMAESSLAVRRHWRTMVIELVHGQTLDLTGAAWREADPERALTIARLKSGAYTIQRPLELGALVAGADTAALGPLSEYGEQLGIAFALRDDVLGVWGDPVRTGKPAGDDLAEGKPTLIMALAAQRLGDLPVLTRVGTPALTRADVRHLQQVLADCGIREELEERISAHLARALTALERVPAAAGDTGPDPVEAGLDPIDALTAVAHQIARRDR